MEETNNNFIGYEYKDLTVKKSLKGVYLDGYKNFGWELESAPIADAVTGKVTFKLKRDRKICNKAELTRLQQQFDTYAKSIERLDASKKSVAEKVALSIGIVGTAFMAGSVFAVTNGIIWLCAVLAVPGFAGWILPYFIYKAISAKKTAKVAPLIERTYDDIYDICEKGNRLLNNL